MLRRYIVACTQPMLYTMYVLVPQLTVSSAEPRELNIAINKSQDNKRKTKTMQCQLHTEHNPIIMNDKSVSSSSLILFLPWLFLNIRGIFHHGAFPMIYSPTPSKMKRFVFPQLAHSLIHLFEMTYQSHHKFHI